MKGLVSFLGDKTRVSIQNDGVVIDHTAWFDGSPEEAALKALKFLRKFVSVEERVIQDEGYVFVYNNTLFHDDWTDLSFEKMKLFTPAGVLNEDVWHMFSSCQTFGDIGALQVAIGRFVPRKHRTTIHIIGGDAGDEVDEEDIHSVFGIDHTVVFHESFDHFCASFV